MFSLNVTGKLIQVTSKDVKGAVYCLLEFNGKVLAGINSAVSLFIILINLFVNHPVRLKFPAIS